MPVRRTIGDEAAAPGRADCQRSGPRRNFRETNDDGERLTASHDGYLARFGLIHRRVLTMAHDGSRLEGEDTLAPAPGGRMKGGQIDYALRFHLHPSVKASRLSDAHGVMLVLPNREVWTFEAPDDRVDLEDSVFLAGNDGPRRTAQIVIHQNARRGPPSALEFRPFDRLGHRHQRPPQCAARAGIAAVDEMCRQPRQSRPVSSPANSC